MRNSQRALVAALGVVVVAMLGVVTWLRLNAEAAPELSGQRSSRTYDLTGFDGVSVSGQWEVTIERGDTWRVAVDVPAEVIDDLRVELDADDVSLGFERAWWFGDDDRRSLMRHGHHAGARVRRAVRCPAAFVFGLRGRAARAHGLGRCQDRGPREPVRRARNRP